MNGEELDQVDRLRDQVEQHLGNGVRVVSFDVFDTLIHRRLAPQFVKDRTAALLRHRLVEMGVQPEEAFDLGRPEIEQSLLRQARRQGLDPEIRIGDLCRQMVERALSSDDERVSELAAWLERVEVEGERLACYPIEAMVEFVEWLRPRAERVIFTSDMYLGSANVQSILDHCGYGGLFDAGFASGDHCEYKVTGKLFERVAREIGCPPHEILHIGDHAEADLQGARLAGLEAINHAVDYLPGFKERERLEHDRVVTDRRYAAQVVHDAAVRSLPTPQSFEQQYGQHLAGAVFAPFVHDVIERVEQEGIEALYFLSRDGFLFLRMYEVARAELDRPGAHVDARYVCMSRSPTLKATLNEGLPLKAIISAKNHLAPSVRTLINTFVLLGFDRAEIASHMHRHGLEPTAHFGDWFLHNPRFHALTNDRMVLREARRIGRSERQKILDYLTQEGFFEYDRVGLVDIGWGGTIQDQLHDLLQDVPDTPELSGFYYGGNLSLIQRRTPDNWMDYSIVAPYSVDGYMPLGVAAAHGTFGLIEELARAPHGTCSGFTRIEGVVKPVLRDDTARPEEIAAEAILSSVQRGVLDYSQGYFRASELLLAASEEMKGTARAALQRVIVEPDERELTMWWSVTHTNDIGGNVELAEQLLPEPSHSRHAIWSWRRELHRSQWKHGAVRASLGKWPSRLYSPFWMIQNARRRQAPANRDRFAAPFLFTNTAIRSAPRSVPLGDLYESEVFRSARRRADQFASEHRSALRDVEFSMASRMAIVAAIALANRVPNRLRHGIRTINDGWPQQDVLRDLVRNTRLGPGMRRAIRFARGTQR